MRTELDKLITRAKELGIVGEQADDELAYERIRTYLDHDRTTLQQMMQVLGPKSVCQCAGCAYETDEAIRLLNTLGIQYLLRKKRKHRKHDPEAEQRGNEPS